MPRHAALIAAALAACAMNTSAQTTSTTPTDATQPPPAPRKTCVMPVYPKEALRNEWTGKSTLSFLIGVDGRVKDSKVVKSSGHEILDEAAREALSKCQFKPATVDGKLQEAWHPVQYVWTLD
jgi:protein TonB